MRKIPTWVWALAAAGVGYYLYTKYKSTTLALTTGASVGGQQVALPGTTSALNTASSQIGAGITSLFNQL